MLKLLVVEDHALVREGLLQTLSGLEPGALAVGAAGAAAALELLAQGEDYELILLDLMLPGTHGLGLLGVLRKRFPTIPVVILSAIDDADTIARAMKQGASGFVPKTSSGEVLLDALREVLAGRLYLPPALPGRRVPRRRSAAERFGLTPGQARVFELLAQGMSNRQIGELLGLTEGTVKVHVSAIFKAMNVSNRAQALLLLNRPRVRL